MRMRYPKLLSRSSKPTSQKTLDASPEGSTLGNEDLQGEGVSKEVMQRHVPGSLRHFKGGTASTTRISRIVNGLRVLQVISLGCHVLGLRTAATRKLTPSIQILLLEEASSDLDISTQIKSGVFPFAQNLLLLAGLYYRSILDAAK